MTATPSPVKATRCREAQLAITLTLDLLRRVSESHLAAVRGAYLIRDYLPDQPRSGTVYVRGAMPTRNVLNVLPELTKRGISVKIVAAISPQLLARQAPEYQRSAAAPADRLDAMVISNSAFKLMRDWADGPLVREYSLSSD